MTFTNSLKFYILVGTKFSNDVVVKMAGVEKLKHC